jgi:HEAT repeat protein
MLIATMVSVALSGSMWAPSPAGQPTPPSAAELVAELGQFRAGLPGTGLPDATEIRRRAVYDRLWTLGPAALPALIQGLADPDVQIRRNVALFLGAAGGGWYQSGRTPLDIRDCLPALIVALADADPRVRQLAADAVGAIGADAAAAVPQLIALLASPDEGSRNTACIALSGIGRGAREALPALRGALGDPSSDVRRFAQRAIDAIER